MELADSETVARYVADLHDLLNESSLVERKSFVRSFVKEVKVTGNEALLTYTIPMLPRGIIEEKLPVLSIVHDGGEGGTVPELLFEKKQLVPALQQLLTSSPVEISFDRTANGRLQSGRKRDPYPRWEACRGETFQNDSSVA